jgi:hypothetical protein
MKTVTPWRKKSKNTTYGGKISRVQESTEALLHTDNKQSDK